MNGLGRLWLDLEEWSLNRLAGWARRRRPEWRELPAHLWVGMEGERAALFHLRRSGYTVVAQRWTSGEVSGDLDLIAWKDGLLCFVEVKTRTAEDMAPPGSALDAGKQAALKRMASEYLEHMQVLPAQTARFDMISVYLLANGRRRFEHVENVFAWGAGGEE